MKRGLTIAFVFILALTFTQALSLSTIEVNQLSCATFESTKNTFIGMEIPEEIPYGDEIFNIYFGGEIFGYLEIEENKIKDLGCEENPEMTYSVYIKDYSTLREFIDVEKPIELLKEKLKNGEIEVKGASFGKKLKWGFTRFGLNFVKAFYKS